MSILRISPVGPSSVMVALAALMLGGCALMGGGGKPSDLYTFGVTSAPAAPAAMRTPPVTILYAGAAMPSQSSGVRILTENGTKVAYIAEARWAAPAAELFDAATIRKLEGTSSLRVFRPGARAKADYQLTIDVPHFAAVYSASPLAPPEAVIELRVKLIRISDRAILGDWPIEERVPAGENRVSAIVTALDRATDAATTRIANLAQQQAARNGS